MARDLMETDTSNMSDTEFKATIIKILVKLQESMEDIRETYPLPQRQKS